MNPRANGKPAFRRPAARYGRPASPPGGNAGRGGWPNQPAGSVAAGQQNRRAAVAAEVEGWPEGPGRPPDGRHRRSPGLTPRVSRFRPSRLWPAPPLSRARRLASEAQKLQKACLAREGVAHQRHLPAGPVLPPAQGAKRGCIRAGFDQRPLVRVDARGNREAVARHPDRAGAWIPRDRTASLRTGHPQEPVAVRSR
jgi:hypothetical protein